MLCMNCLANSSISLVRHIHRRFASRGRLRATAVVVRVLLSRGSKRLEPPPMRRALELRIYPARRNTSAAGRSRIYLSLRLRRRATRLSSTTTRTSIESPPRQGKLAAGSCRRARSTERRHLCHLGWISRIQRNTRKNERCARRGPMLTAPICLGATRSDRGNGWSRKPAAPWWDQMAAYPDRIVTQAHRTQARGAAACATGRCGLFQ
jgi:hypothetical protein